MLPALRSTGEPSGEVVREVSYLELAYRWNLAATASCATTTGACHSFAAASWSYGAIPDTWST